MKPQFFCPWKGVEGKYPEWILKTTAFAMIQVESQNSNTQGFQ